MAVDTIDHDKVIGLCNDMGYMRADIAEVKHLLQSQNGRIRKLEERWWIAMGGLLVGSAVLNWVLFQAGPLVVRALIVGIQ